jgi:hypothetical protein
LGSCIFYICQISGIMHKFLRAYMLVHYQCCLVYDVQSYIIFFIHPKVVCKCLGYNLCRVGAGSTTVLHRDGEQYSSRRASRAGHLRQASAPRRDWMTLRDGEDNLESGHDSATILPPRRDRRRRNRNERTRGLPVYSKGRWWRGRRGRRGHLS